MKIPGKSAGSGSISRLAPQFAGRGRLNPTALPHRKGEQKSNRESLRRVRADDSARRNDDVTAVTQRKERTRTCSNREKEALFSSAKSLQITIRTDRSLPIPADPCHQNGEQNSNRESRRLDAVVTKQNSSNRENELSKLDRIPGKSRAGVRARGRQLRASRAQQAKRPYAE